MPFEPTPDKLSGAVVTITNEHSKIHDGKTFHAHYESDPTDSNLIGEETAIGFVTPPAASGRIHMIIDVRADEESVWELREDPAVVLGSGSPFPPTNRFRDSALESAMISQGTPPVANRYTTYDVGEANTAGLAGGTILEHETIAIAGGPPFAGNENAAPRGQREWILAADTEYVIILTCSTNNNTTHEISLHWYETVDKKYIR